MTGRRPQTWHALFVSVVVGCQAVPPSVPPAPPPVPRDIVARLDVAQTVVEQTRIPVLGSVDDEPATPASAADVLSFDDVMTSVETHFPLILAAQTEIEAARGRALSAAGAFDTQLSAKGTTEVEGFYETDRLDVELSQPLRLGGARVFGGYRIGRGDFAIYDGKAKTDDGGEFRMGVGLPLLQGREIDPRRVAEWRALIDLERADPLIDRKRLEATLKAAETYWKWVAAGRLRDIAKLVLGLAEDRQAQIEFAAEEGELAPLDVIDNERLIVDRRSKLVAAERKLQEAAITLSLFLRDETGRPRVPSPDALPPDFPEPRPPAALLVPDDVERALDLRPELRAVELELAKLDLEVDLTRNKLLPKLDVEVFASQDVGATVNTPDDKGPFEVGAGLRFGVPLQRRGARGKLRELDAKISKQRRELQYAREVVQADVLDAVSALRQNWDRLGQARENVRLANELAVAERVRVDAGESDLFRLNVREQQAVLASEELIAVLEEHFASLARYRAVLGVGYEDLTPGR